MKPGSESARRTLLEPDFPIDWREVEQVARWDLGRQSVASQCPICLDPPSPAMITKCGHVFWCVNRMQGEKWRVPTYASDCVFACVFCVFVCLCVHAIAVQLGLLVAEYRRGFR